MKLSSVGFDRGTFRRPDRSTPGSLYSTTYGVKETSSRLHPEPPNQIDYGGVPVNPLQHWELRTTPSLPPQKELRLHVSTSSLSWLQLVRKTC